MHILDLLLDKVLFDSLSLPLFSHHLVVSVFEGSRSLESWCMVVDSLLGCGVELVHVGLFEEALAFVLLRMKEVDLLSLGDRIHTSLI